MNIIDMMFYYAISWLSDCSVFSSKTKIKHLCYEDDKSPYMYIYGWEKEVPRYENDISAKEKIQI